MQKVDLRDGMMLELRDRREMLYLNNSLYTKEGLGLSLSFIDLDSYNDDLMYVCQETSILDIMKEILKKINK